MYMARQYDSDCHVASVYVEWDGREGEERTGPRIRRQGLRQRATIMFIAAAVPD